MNTARKIDKAVVLGATGFIGNYLVEALIEKNVKVVAVVREGSEKKLRASSSPLVDMVIIEDTVSDTLGGMKLSANTVCFNLFWQGVTGADRGDYRIQLDNVKTALDSMEILAKKGCETFVGASSISEIDVDIYAGRDGARLPGRYMYGAAKLSMDYMCRIESGLLDVDYINAVIGNVYGEYGDDNLLLHSTIIKLLKHEKTLFTEGIQWYDFVYIKDVVRALILLAYHGNGSVSYYIGSGKERPLKEYLTAIGEKIDKNAELGFGKIESDGYSMPEEMFDIGKIKEETGYRPENDFEKNIDSVIAYYRKKLGE